MLDTMQGVKETYYVVHLVANNCSRSPAVEAAASAGSRQG